MFEEQDDRLAELLNEADTLPDGPAKLAVIEEAVRLTDSLGDIRAGFGLRIEYLMWNAICSGHPDKMLVAFSWCLARHDASPEEYDAPELLWRYVHWVIYALRKWPQFSRKQLADALADLSRRVQRAGHSQRAVACEHCKTSLALGDLADAADWYDRWHALPFDASQNGQPEERRDEISHFLAMGDLERAVSLAEPVLAGRIRSDTVPHGPFAELMVPLVRLRRIDDAVRCHLHGYSLVNRQIRWLGEVGRHLEFAVLTDNLDLAIRMLERHMPWTVVSVEVDDRFYFHLGARFLFERLRERGTTSLRLRLPRECPFWRADGVYEVPTLSAWFDAECERVVALYDARNGNDHFSRLTLGTSRRLREWVTPTRLVENRGPKVNK